ncbi:MAG TPA: alcohol dehydrogenase catalytic domain-containing protein [Acidimicrobiales bacterium]|nr:alcohol dehydrogenase catalytic domain-containing protein [Acidimicrobiales bacterium]
MRAVEASPDGLGLVEAPPPAVPPGWARVQVRACGLCRSDLHLLGGGALPPGVSWPLRPGHEVSGVVIDGADDGGPEPGTPVVLQTLRACGDCPACRGGTEERCPGARVLGIHDPGGMADQVAWPAARLVPVPGLDPVEAAVLPDAVATAHHALRLAALDADATLCVIGAGGVGFHVIELARLLHPGVRVVTVARSEATARRLTEAGVEVVRPLEGAGRGVRKAAGPAQAVIDFSGAAEAPAEGIRMLGPGGRLVLGSILDQPVTLGMPMTGVVTRELTVTGCYASTLADLSAVAGLATAHRLDLAGSVSARFPLEEADRAFRALEERAGGTVRIVLDAGNG